MTTKDAIKHLSDKIDYAEQCDDKWVDSVSIKALYIAVKAMAEERKKGKWVLINDNNGQHAVCEFCGEWKYHQKQNYCGHCGADMREEESDAH